MEGDTRCPRPEHRGPQKHTRAPAQVRWALPPAPARVAAISISLHPLVEMGKGKRSSRSQCPVPAFYGPLGQKGSRILPHPLKKQKTTNKSKQAKRTSASSAEVPLGILGLEGTESSPSKATFHR